MSKNISIPYNLQKIAKRLGQHEVGHWIVARELGFKTGDLCIKIVDCEKSFQGKSEIVLAVPIKTLEDVVQYLEKRIITLYSGILAEWLENDKINIEQASKNFTITATHDSTKIIELTNLIRNIKYHDVLDESKIQDGMDSICDELWDKSISMVIKTKSIIYGLGARLASEVKKIGKEYKLKKEEIETLPAIIEYFSNNSSTN